MISWDHFIEFLTKAKKLSLTKDEEKILKYLLGNDYNHYA